MRFAAVALFPIALTMWGQAQQPLQSGKHAVVVRGLPQNVYFVPARNLPKGALNVAILFVPGAGGWSGWATEIGDTMAGWGHDVFGLDTNRYLESFRSGSSNLNERQVSADMASVGHWAQQGLNRKLMFVGWSEGAALGVLALVPPANKSLYQGLIVFELPSLVAGWPASGISPLLPQLPPAPFYMIQSTTDQSVPLDAAKKLFASAREPKLLKIINAQDAQFGGNRDGFFQALHEGIEWAAKQKPQ